MRFTEPDEPASQAGLTSDAEERLRKENQELRRQIHELKGTRQHVSPPKVWRPSRITIGAILLTGAILIAIAFVAGYIPRQKRLMQINSEAQEQDQALTRVEVVQVGRGAPQNGLQLPGNFQAITEAPVLARADGYLGRRMVDIGDRVKSGQPLAEIEAPELDAQVRQSKAGLQQARA